MQIKSHFSVYIPNGLAKKIKNTFQMGIWIMKLFLQFVLDAYQKGDKLKFANHSPRLNRYAKIPL